MRNNILLKIKEISQNHDRPNDWVELQIANLKYKLGKKDLVTRILNNTSQPSWEQLDMISDILNELADNNISITDLIEVEPKHEVA